MSLDDFRWEETVVADEEFLLGLMEAFYGEEQLVFSEAEARAAVQELLARPEIGRVFLLRKVMDGRHGGRPARTESVAVDGEGSRTAYGYLVLTFGFSLEFHGRFVLLDELYIAPDLRGQGWGRGGIEFSVTWARAQGVAAVRLEVKRANAHAREVYLRRGFRDEVRDLLTRWVGPAGGGDGSSE